MHLYKLQFQISSALKNGKRKIEVGFIWKEVKFFGWLLHHPKILLRNVCIVSSQKLGIV